MSQNPFLFEGYNTPTFPYTFEIEETNGEKEAFKALGNNRFEVVKKENSFSMIGCDMDFMLSTLIIISSKKIDNKLFINKALFTKNLYIFFGAYVKACGYDKIDSRIDIKIKEFLDMINDGEEVPS
jgi:hypothetical protein